MTSALSKFSNKPRPDYERLLRDIEAEFVRENLTLVNQRLKAEGLREIDASDSKMAERYGL